MRHPGSLPAAALCLSACLAGCSDGGLPDGDSPVLYTVRRGDLRITVSEPAEIRAAEETRVKSQVEGTATVIFLIDEGSVVEKGEKLVELDASNLIDRKANQEISLERAKAALVEARQNLKIQRKEIRAAEETARSELRIAEMELEKFLGKPMLTEAADGSGEVPIRGTNAEMLARLRELVKGTTYARLPDQVRAKLLRGPADLHRDMGEMAQRILQQIDQIRLADADLKVKEDTLGHSKRLAKKRYITKNELDKDELAYQSQLSKVTLAWNELDLMVNYTLKKDQIQLLQNVGNAQLELERVIAANKAREAREEADLRSKEAEYTLAKERFDNLVEQIENAVMYAPTPGLVVYATQGDGRRGREVVEEGGQVHERQTLIILPDVTRMVCDLKVKEADIDKVAVGQRAAIHVDAFPEMPFTGTVSRVSPLPDSGSRWSNDDLKVYKTRVTVDGVNEVLRPGMSARVEIAITRIEDTPYVPLQAVRRQGASHYVWKATAEGPAATPVRVGQNNLTHVQVLEGVGEGDTVFLSPPSGVEVPELDQPGAGSESTERPSGTEDPADAEGAAASIPGASAAARPREAGMRRSEDEGRGDAASPRSREPGGR